LANISKQKPEMSHPINNSIRRLLIDFLSGSINLVCVFFQFQKLSGMLIRPEIYHGQVKTNGGLFHHGVIYSLGNYQFKL
jgi:hypothetical protein